MSDQYNHISSEDFKEAREIAEMLKGLDTADKKIISIYVGALRDRKMYTAG